MANNQLLDALLALPEAERLAELRLLSRPEQEELRFHWRLWARAAQLAPLGDWRTWLIMAGRGFGKTRAGAEWVRALADADPQARIALVGSSLGDARAVMVEGESGLLAVCADSHFPAFEPSLKRLTWPNGAQATLYSALEPESLRGPQHSHGWCDEIAKWDNVSDKARRTWDNLLLGLRLGTDPRLMATTTPRAVPLVKRLNEADPDEVIVTRGATEDNRHNLPPRYITDIRKTFGQTPVKPRKKASSMKRPRGLIACCTVQSKANRRPRPPRHWKDKCGWSAPGPAVPGLGKPVNWQRTNLATGCSSLRATG